MKLEYRALRSTQADPAKKLVMFSAPAPEINLWAGIPQKKRFGTGEETAGFQREENQKRLKSLAEFYADRSNIIQNPLLCSIRDLKFASVKFVPDSDIDDDISEFGTLVIEFPEYEKLSLREVLRMVKAHLESRVPHLSGLPVRQDLLATLKARAAEAGHVDSSEAPTDVESIDSTNDDDAPDPSAALFEESHIVDFWNEIACRHVIVEEIGDSFGGDEFLGFTKEALISYLKPVVLVDGQHRLGGAIYAAVAAIEKPELQAEIEARVIAGEDDDVIRKDLISRNSRALPISLLMSSSPGEQVFQFVIVNQKATPVGKALLGTIVSTSLSNEEMEAVAGRLKSAGIELVESQAITYLARYPDSPFFNLIERGMTGDGGDLLKWNVFSSLIAVFRDLKGGKLFGQKNDYADTWRVRLLSESKIIDGYQSEGCESPLEYWSRIDGPWRSVFISFWVEVRNKLGSVDDPDRYNFWGRPRDSNLFNKVSLNILAADFFQYLTETKSTIDSAEGIPDLVESWLEYVNRGYFDKNWDLAGVKKDSTGIRNQWALLWGEYRKAGGNLPDKRLYRKPKND